MPQRQLIRTPPRPPALLCWLSAPASASMTWPSSSAPAGRPRPTRSRPARRASTRPAWRATPAPRTMDSPRSTPRPRCRWPISAGSRRPPCPGTPPSSARWPSAATRVLVFLGRTHLYEGHPVADRGARGADGGRGGLPDSRAHQRGRAASGPGYQVGQPVLIRDHLNLTGRSPLAGPPPPDGYPSRFTDLTDLYSPRLRELAIRRRPWPGRGRLRGAAGTALRDPGRDQDAARAGRRPGRHVHRA